MSASTSTPPIPPRVAAKPPVKPRVSSPPAHVATFSSSSPSPAAAPLGLDHDRFGSCLQTCYDAINKRHEEELRALESLRVHIFNRAKADREYAESLARINQRATRGVANITQQSAIVQAWKCFIEVSEDIQKRVSTGSTQMSTFILQAVDQLIKDKRGAKKVFDSDRLKTEDDYHRSFTEMQNMRRDYKRYLQATETSKRKLEATLAKDPPAKPQEQEKLRKRFVSCSDKLHSCHNNYSLAVLNTNAHQDTFRSSLLPFCLDTLQERMELQITQWKEALVKYSQAMDLVETYEESFQRINDSLRQIEMEDEYVEFIKENKKDSPSVEFYTFDEQLLQGYCSPKTEPCKVIINNLTHNAMKTRLASLESDLDAHERELSQKQEELQQILSTPSEENGLLSPTNPSATPTQLPRHIRISMLRSKVKELTSMQLRKQGQAALIREAVDQLGDVSPPLFDVLGEGVDISDFHTHSAASASAGTGKTGNRLTVGTLKKGLRGFIKKAGRKSKSDVGGASVSHSESRDDITPDDSVISEKGEDSDSDTGSLYDVPPELPVEEEDWFFGEIDRKLSEAKCGRNGDYLVRYSSRQNKYVLTCNWNGHGKHFVIQCIADETGQQKYRFESKAFPSIRELLSYHVQYGTAVTRASGAVILNSVTRFDKWSLQHDNVQRGKKIGKGCFGDVYEGVLTKTAEKVAVKTCRSDALQDMDKFLKEAEILKQYDHPNIVRLIGVCAEKDPVYIVMELMPGGAFLDFLRKRGTHQAKKKLCGMVVDASKGMEYLESMNCIHRDLAARNCLVGDSDVVKISDFGMSREEEGGVYTVSSGTRAIPIKWTAPEALNYGKYTSMSDVWSFGVLLWETFSCGSAPYPGMSNHEARTQVEVGYRMPAPADCPGSVYNIMTQCWQDDAEERPTFAQVAAMLVEAYERMA